jgi:transcriptional regulator with XRE-family HTH domain
VELLKTDRVRGATPPLEEPRRAFGARIRRARREQGISQEGLAAAIRVSSPYISHLEQGIRIPSDKVCRAIAEVLSDVGLQWQELVIEAHKLRTPDEETAAIFTAESTNTKPEFPKKLSQSPAFRKLVKTLQDESFSADQIEVMAEFWRNHALLEQRRRQPRQARNGG